MIPTLLRSSGLSRPLALDSPPVFSWQVKTDETDVVLIAAEVRVLDARGAEVWRSGWVGTPSIPSIAYAGPALTARAAYTWSVRVRDGRAVESDWSAPAWFETGVLGEGFEGAAWIRLDEQTPHGEAAPVQYLRHEFDVTEPVIRARVYSTALGWYRLHINDVDVTGPGLFPGFTAFDTRVEYQVHDVAEVLVEGRNAIGIVLSDGRFRGRIGAMGSPAMYGDRTTAIAFLELEHADGSRSVIRTDGSWVGGHGEIVAADNRGGETIDARLRSAWSIVGGTLPEHVPVTEVDESRTLVGASAEPTTHATALPATGTHRAPSGKLVVDFGQNLHGVARIVARGPRGAEIVVSHSEVLGKDGEVDWKYLIAGIQADIGIGPDRFILSGEEDVFVPTFATQGFRYISVEAPDDVEFLDFSSIPVHAELDYHGTFDCSNELVTRFHDNVVWSMRGNFLDVPTDCPTRERSGWTGDAQVFAPTALLLAQTGRYFTNWLVDMRAQQHADGTITDIVPLDSPNWREGAEPTEKEKEFGFTMPPSGSAGWGDAIVLIPWEVYQATGTRDVLVDNYPTMVRWIERYALMAESTGDSGLPHGRYLVDSGYHWGEWLEPEGEGDGVKPMMELMADLFARPRSWVATAYFEHSSRILSQIAALLGENDDSRRFSQYAEGARAAWQEAYMTNPALLEPDAQATYVRALEFGLVPEERRQATVDRLVERIRDRDTHLGTGFLSTAFLLRQLSRNGRTDVALDLLLQQTPPSWLGQVVRGATTTWETWTGHDADGNPLMSHNHYSLGGSVRWLYEDLAGLRPAAPGWRRILVDPLLTPRIPAVAASTGTPFGDAAVKWTLDSDQAVVVVTVPAGTEATVVLRGADAATTAIGDATVAESGRAHRHESGALLVEVGSGRHQFTWSTAA
ncbi:family 78 glycoside hydrolase catalytic domain [Actinoplanes sp. NPDC023936]|uniref:family 78 glycoside hydrolase catalytic domain n=1 Tax=Actinoplanes sp. NPDC023936 TaxID=3154910 RepID=UPI00340C3142